MNIILISSESRVLLEEITNKKTNINKVRQKINMVFQYFNLFDNKTVLQNITIAPIKLKKIDKK